MNTDCPRCSDLQQQLAAANAEIARLRALVPQCKRALNRLDEAIATLPDPSSGVLGESEKCDD